MMIPFFLFRPDHPPSGASTGNRIGETKVEKERAKESPNGGGRKWELVVSQEVGGTQPLVVSLWDKPKSRDPQNLFLGRAIAGHTPA